MLNLHIVQAAYGDCLILEYGTMGHARYILVDGGPADNYRAHLLTVLQALKREGGSLERVILSHVDVDHIGGVLHLMADLRRQRRRGMPATIEIAGLWHNTFSDTVGGDIADHARALLQDSSEMRDMMPVYTTECRSIDQGDRLTRDAEELGIAINHGFSGGVITVDSAPPTITFDNLRLHILGPTEENLEALRLEWLDWLGAEKRLLSARGARDEQAIWQTDAKAPNLSSIMVLAEAGGKTILLPGDGRGDHLLEALAHSNVLEPKPDGSFHVDVVKLPHHGSERNVSPEFFSKLTADRYVISADGTYGNPDLPTLKALVEAARDQGRTIEIWITNRPRSVDRLVRTHKPRDYGYRLVKLRRGNDRMVLSLER